MLIRLVLPPEKATFACVKKLPGLDGLKLDAKYGLVPIGGHGYVVRAKGPPENVKPRVSPEIQSWYPGPQVSPVGEKKGEGTVCRS
ncbi:MAG: hypothetical protein E6G97_18325 [Alphaproteobacteria bacterium]|nr:MAG: hypothetical protein E6G97_18325 [Alphaproteobacteria bacterium]